MSKRVIIFDDDPDILNICSIILTARGYQVATNTSCDNLLEAITEFEPNVIVMDNKIPAIGGVEATRLIKGNAATAHIPVVFFSANTHVAELTREAGADIYIQKPFDISTFEQVLGQMIARANVE